MPPFTAGFATPSKLTEHFLKHGADLALATEQDYLAQADTFLGGPLAPGVTEGVRASDGDTVRFNAATQEYGVLRPDRTIRTYYRCTGGPPRNAAWFAKKLAK